MGDGATAAPAAAPASTPVANGATGAVVPSSGTVKPTPAKPAAAAAPAAPSPSGRAPDGRFLPKEGTAGEVKPDAEPGEGETKAQAEERRFKAKLKVYGKEEDVDYSEADVVRELQKGRALLAKQREWQEGQAKAQRIFELAQTNPEAFLRAVGKDPDDFARKALAAQARLGAMTNEERAIHERDQKIAAYEARDKERADAEANAQATKKKEVLLERNKTNFMAGLEKVGLPKSYETLYLMAETAKLAMDDGIEYSPEELARETERRVDQYTERYLGNLDGKALAKKLGAKRVKSILEASIADFNASQQFGTPAPKAVEPKATVPEDEDFVDEYELSRRLRGIR